MEDFITIELGSSFLINAGILGFLKFLRHNNAEENVDFIIKGQYLYVSKSYMLEKDISNMYVDTVAEILYKQPKITRVFDSISNLKYILSNDKLNEKEKLSESKFYFDSANELFKKASFNNGCLYYINEYPVMNEINKYIKEVKQEKVLEKKISSLEAIVDLIKSLKLYSEFIMRDLISYIFQYFYSVNPMTKVMGAFNKITNQSISMFYNSTYLEPLINKIKLSEQKGELCIECRDLTKSSRSISFLVDTTDDVTKKKSYYWNCNPDAFVCEKCAFLYTFVPIGFTFLGYDAVFINNNTNIATLEKMMNTYEVKKETEIDGKSRFYKSFIDLKSQILKNKIHNIQVIIRNNQKKHYQFNIIDKEMISNLLECSKYFSNLEKLKRVQLYSKTEYYDGYVNVFEEVFENILYNRNQYDLINKLIKSALAKNEKLNYVKDTYFIMNILKIQIYFKGGSQLENLKKNVDIAFNSGKEMRGKIADGMKDADIDNSLRGFVYKLSNAVSVNNRDQFIDSVIRVYSGKGLPMPYIFKECFISDEMFKAIGQGFILGLKYIKYEKENKADE